MRVKILLLFLILSSCTTLKYALEEKITAKKDCMPFAVNGLPTIEMELSHKKHQFIFDTGAMASVLLDSTVIEGFTEKKFATFGSTVGADRKQKKGNRLFTTQVATPLFSSDNKLMAFSTLPKTKCGRSPSFKGIIGLDVFFEKGLAMVLNFTNNEICNIEPSEIPARLKQDPTYSLIRSDCYQNQIFVYVYIEGKEYKFKVDTGYSDFLIMPSSEQPQFRSENSITLSGATNFTVSDATVGSEEIFEKLPMHFAGIDFEGKINVSTTIRTQNMGIKLIKAFDWIIDYRHNKIYVKRSSNKLENPVMRKISYRTTVASDNKLRISLKESQQNQYHLGDEIIAVNGQRVTDSNNCEMQELLNKTINWDTLTIETIPFSK